MALSTSELGGTVAQQVVSWDAAAPMVAVGIRDVEYAVFLMDPRDGTVEVEQVLSVPDGVRVERATFALAASASGQTSAASVAELRGVDADSVVVDFGRMVTVSGVGFTDGDREVTGVSRWTGAGFQYVAESDSFPEFAGERMLVTTSGSGGTEATMRAHGVVYLEKRPGSLELLVDGTTVWFERQGSAPDLVTRRDDGTESVPGVSGDVEFAVDRTDAVRDALAKAQLVDGHRQVVVRLRAANPGTLQLLANLQVLQEHTVTFGASSHSTEVVAVEEGLRDLDLPGPFTSGDRIREVALTLTGSFGPARVEPVVGPALDVDAETGAPLAQLVLGSGRTLLFGIPTALASLFGELGGLRLHLTCERGAEFAGRVLGTDAAGLPGALLRGGDLPPVQVPAGQAGWFTVALPKPVPVPDVGTAPVAAWLELVPSYGEVLCGLTATDQGARVLRRLPGGGTRDLSALLTGPDASVTTRLRAALRVVGLPGRRDLRPAVAVSVPGAEGTALADPTGDGVRVVLGLGAGIPGGEGSVPLRLRIAAPGSVVVDDVVVAYKKAGT